MKTLYYFSYKIFTSRNYFLVRYKAQSMKVVYSSISKLLTFFKIKITAPDARRHDLHHQ